MTSTFEVLETSGEQSYDPDMASEPVQGESGPVYDAADEAWRLLTAVLMVRKEQFPELAASFGLNPGALHALLQLDPDEPQSMSSLAGAWKCDASNVTWLVDRLEEHGLAERRAHPGDRRIRTVAITQRGAEIRSQVEARMYEAPDNLRALSARDLEALAKILRKIAPAPAPRPRP
jgi:DNA-binding MarR family transcriptional regulator